jgi:hypothetical protein
MELRRWGAVVGAVFCLSALSSPVFGSAITADGTTYHEFTFGGTAPAAALGCGPANAQTCSPTSNPVAETNSTSPWTFTGPGTIFVQDLGDIGEIFQVMDGTTVLGTTSAPGGSGAPCGAGSLDIACAMTHDTGTNHFSSGSFPVGAEAIRSPSRHWHSPRARLAAKRCFAWIQSHQPLRKRSAPHRLEWVARPVSRSRSATPMRPR